MAHPRLEYLFERYKSQSCSQAEQTELAMLCLLPENKEAVELLLQQTWDQIEITRQMPAEKGEQILQLILQQSQQLPAKETATIRSINWKRIAVAASIIGVLFVAGYFMLSDSRSTKGNELSAVEGRTNDISAPDKNRAQIKLADGRIIYLDSAANGELVNTNGITVTKTEDGKIVYAVIPTKEGSVEYNTLMNPRGSKIQPLTLSDGTKLWLNAESSVTYPTAFAGNQRRVQITGEAYFEVAHNKSKPFIVSANNKADVTVLGTHFNVNAYNDEKDIKVTLVEGSVRVSNDVDAKTIKPNQQVTVEAHSPLTIHHSPDLEQILSWKNNDFIFQDDTLESIMRQLARWYNINPIFTNQSAPSNSTNYTGRITRTVPISEVLAMFEKLGYVKFQINGNDVKIIPVR